MAEFKWIQMALFGILLQFTEVAGQTHLYITVRAGDDVPLPCENVITQDNCDQTTWLSSYNREAAVELIAFGQIRDNITKTKPDRLSVTENCSLVIKNVTGDDAGRYICRQFYTSGQQLGPDAVVHLSVVTMEELKNTDDSSTLTCSVLTYSGCDLTVEWLYEGDENNVEITPGTCSAQVLFTPGLNQNLLKCNVTDKRNGNTLLFSFEKSGSSTVGTDYTPENDTAITGQPPLYITVRVGDDVTLPCENVITQGNCDQTIWISGRNGGATGTLIEFGQIKDNIPKSKSDRLSVTENCSLVIKNVTGDDVGRYTCRQFYTSGHQLGPDAEVLLSGLYLSEEKNNDTVILICFVLSYDNCDHTVEWLYEGDENDVEITQRVCSAQVSFTPRVNQKLPRCNATDKRNGNMLLCNVGPRSSCKKTAGGRNKKDGTSTTQGYLRFIMVSLGLAALITTVVAANVWMRTKGNKTQMDGNAEHGDEDEGTVAYENVEEPSVSISLH
ncbi:uncharacterized protein LOC116706110 [Etheostoma spectabile]|uniref:uncharacterized protein LOC116706110 n=1 Tax=Etheostoma spectabile TaxID=54343 RepID=UPI0013AFAB06|nr:uncharacterized protein LOC116706110 [Etheostoma spectabile]